jgi:hypothetical protein
MTANRSDIPEDILSEAELLDEPGGKTLRLRFEGSFEGRHVTWLATLHALLESPSTDLARQHAANYIEIGAAGPDSVPITVGLQVERIDPPTVRKAMIMIRRYRRLRRGRHEYTPSVEG